MPRAWVYDEAMLEAALAEWQAELASRPGADRASIKVGALHISVWEFLSSDQARRLRVRELDPDHQAPQS